MSLTVFESAQSKTVIVVEVDGSVDISSVPELESRINSVMERGYKYIILKLRDLEFMSSAGWGVFIAAKTRITEKGGDIAVAEMHPNVQRVYELMGIEAMLKSYEKVSSAIEEYSRRQG